MQNCCLVFFGLLHFLTGSSQDFDIILGRPTAGSVTLSILFARSASVQVRYGNTPGSYTGSLPVMEFQANVPQEVDIKGLSPNTRYHYVVSYRLTGTNADRTSPEYSFHTQRNRGESFTFTVESDEHLYDKKGIRSMYLVTLANQSMDRPDFMFSLGDIFGDDHLPFTITSQELDFLHKDYRQYLGTVCHSIPFFVGLGNHEGENDYYLTRNPPNNLAVWATLWRKHYYPNPFPNEFYTGNTEEEPHGIGFPENYYAFHWGDALFVVLDPYRYQGPDSPRPGGWDWTLGKRQYDWLRTTLEKSQARFKFVFAHHVRGQGRGGVTNAKFFEWGGYDADGKTWGFDRARPGWGKPIHQLFRDNGVTIFFQGHDHLFAHEVLDGIHYQEVPMPSDSTYMIGKLANADAYVSDTLEGTGHIRVKVNANCVEVDYVKAFLPKDTLDGGNRNGQVAFSYTAGSCVVTGIQDLDVDDESFKVYPNPARTVIHIETDLPGPLESTLLGSSGSLILSSKERSIDVSQLKPGLYILRSKAGNKIIRKKIIVGY